MEAGPEGGPAGTKHAGGRAESVEGRQTERREGIEGERKESISRQECKEVGSCWREGGRQGDEQAEEEVSYDLALSQSNVRAVPAP